MIDRGDGVRLATRYREGGSPTLVFLPGYMSDMLGTKAEELDRLAAERGHAMLRFDYSGCGESEGRFDDGSIPCWTDDADAAIARLAPKGALVLIGSSMGGWVMLGLAERLKPRLQGLVGIAAAPDFTRWDLVLTTEEQQALKAQGYIERMSPWGDAPYRYSATFLEESNRSLFLDRAIDVTCPVRLLQGQRDEEVPVEIALKLAAALGSDDVDLTLVKNGDHRLSDAHGLRLIRRVVAELL